MDGIGGRPGWAWIFILVSLFAVEICHLFDQNALSRKDCSQSVSVSLGSLSYPQLQENPDSSLLSKRSARDFISRVSVLTLLLSLIMALLERDRPSIKPSDKFSGEEILHSIRSPHVIILFFVLFMLGTCASGLALFLPSIVSELGFSRNKTQLLSVGPFALGFFGAFIRCTR